MYLNKSALCLHSGDGDFLVKYLLDGPEAKKTKWKQGVGRSDARLMF